VSRSTAPASTAPARPHAQDELNPFDDKVAVKVHCPECGALDWFEWKFLGSLTDPVCGHTWYVGSGFYTAMQIRAAFAAGGRFAKHLTSGVSGEGAWIAKALGWFMGIILGLAIRLELGVLMIPVQALVGLFQARKTTSEVVTRVVVLAVTLAGLGIGFYQLQRASRLQFQPSQPAGAIVAPAAPITSAPPAVSVEPPGSPVWPVIDASAPPSNVIQSLGATVTRIQFFEGGSTIPPPSMRFYGARFASKETRNIYWELDIQHPVHASRTDFTIYAVWYGPGQTELTRQSVNSYVQSEWTFSQHWGNTNGIAFAPGRYRVDFFVDDGHKVADGTFEVFEGDAPPSPPQQTAGKTRRNAQGAAQGSGPEFTLWTEIKKQLIATNGRQYFWSELRDRVVPRLRGTLVGSRPTCNSRELLVAISDASNAEVSVRLATPLNGTPQPGVQIEWEGVPSAFTESPFLLTMETANSKINVLGMLQVSPCAP
jgi:hypothetical protein